MKSRIFNSDEQAAFAELSGDYNPLHMDDIAARRLLFGSTVVHGIHGLLWGLDCCLEGQTGCVQIRAVKATFLRPIRLTDCVQLSIQAEGDNFQLELQHGGTTVTRANFELHDSVPHHRRLVRNCCPNRIDSRRLDDEQIESGSGSVDLCFDVAIADRLFPNATRCISAEQMAVILGTTRLVGVVCPGMNSLFSELKLLWTAPTTDTTFRFETISYDRRVSLVDMKIRTDGMSGSVLAFRRPEPQQQMTSSMLSQFVDKGEFSGQRALIVGGSRGLGEVAAKLLSGGSADVRLTYHQGKADARRIVDDIRSAGGLASSFELDVLNPKSGIEVMREDTWAPTHLYYFATPFAFSGTKRVFSYQLFNNFCKYYVESFVNTVHQVRMLGVNHVFCPSTVAVDELPPNMGEYSAAKAASESVCAWLEKTHRELIIYRPRFPRVATDQTVSVIPVSNHDPVPVTLKELRCFRDGVRSE